MDGLYAPSQAFLPHATREDFERFRVALPTDFEDLHTDTHINTGDHHD
jgi:hypothetical protein